MTTDPFEAVRGALPADRPFALAYSGGGDSLALLSVLRKHPGLKAVLHVDHGLRDGSAEEAGRAAELARSLGHEAVRLVWTPHRVSTGLQKKARDARYGLMGDWCRANSVRNLVTAHHADDQAETVLMRLKRSSGWRGAAGMRARRYAPVWPQLAGVTLVRPALGLPGDVLRSALGDVEPIHDPSNRQTRFERVRIRQELSASPGLRDDMLHLAEAMAEGLGVDSRRIKAELKGHHVTHEGQLSVPRLLSARALSIVSPIVGGQSGPASVDPMAEKLSDIESGKAVSISGGTIAEWDGEILTLSRDPVAISGRSDRKLAPTAVAVAIGPEPQVWDGRFLVSGAAGQIHPERRGHHVGFRVLYGRGVRMENLVAERLAAVLTQM